jgi:alkylation response protein AidB-like acyl-CoA dehydrogenase
MSPVAASIAPLDRSVPAAPSVVESVAAIARRDLAPLVGRIDSGELYPDDVLRTLGAAGAWSSHMPKNGAADLRCAIQSIASLGEVCGATAFMAWCQNTLVWYVTNSANARLGARALHIRSRPARRWAAPVFRIP